jgi:hypothetical protein
MTAAFASFPDCPRHRGAGSDPVPHLTVADGVDASAAAALDTAIAPELPIISRVDRLTLLTEDPSGQWMVVRHWPLGRSGSRLDQPREVAGTRARARGPLASRPLSYGAGQPEGPTNPSRRHAVTPAQDRRQRHAPR